MTMHVGVAGTGKMGTAIACNLIDRGYRVSVWNVDPSMMDAVLAAGATPFETPESLAASVDATIVMLWDDEVAKEVSLGRIIPAVPNGRIVLETTTLSPQMYEELAKTASARGVNFLACPVLGSVDGARAGTLALFPGGSAEAFERARELLSAMGESVQFTGSPAASGHLKLAGNCMLAVVADAIGELLAIMREAGVDRTLAVETLFYMLGRVGTKKQQVLECDTEPRFSANALLKDLRLADATRQVMGARASLMATALAEFAAAVDGGAGNRDYIAAALVRERMDAGSIRERPLRPSTV